MIRQRGGAGMRVSAKMPRTGLHDRPSTARRYAVAEDDPSWPGPL